MEFLLCKLPAWGFPAFMIKYWNAGVLQNCFLIEMLYIVQLMSINLKFCFYCTKLQIFWNLVATYKTGNPRIQYWLLSYCFFHMWNLSADNNWMLLKQLYFYKTLSTIFIEDHLIMLIKNDNYLIIIIWYQDIMWITL